MPRQTSQPQRLESATASPDLLLQSSQSSGSQSEPTNQNSQVSDSSQIHGMMLKYSNNEITNEELRELNLQTAAQQYIIESDAQQKTTPILFQKNCSPLIEPDCSKATAQLLDGTPGIRLQIPYLEEFFGTTWYLIHEDMFELYAIYDTIFIEIPYFAQLQPFDLVVLDTDLQEHLDSRMNHIRTHMEWITQVGDSFTKCLDSAPTCQLLPHSMLTLEQRQEIHKDFVKVTDFLGMTYRAYEELINVDPNNRLEHMTN